MKATTGFFPMTVARVVGSLALFSLSACAMSNVKKETRAIEEADGACAAFAHLDDSMEEFGSKSSFWKYWAEVATRCQDDGGEASELRDAFNRGHGHGLRLTAAMMPLVDASVTIGSQAPSNDADYQVDVRVPVFVSNAELLGVSGASKDGVVRLVIPQAKVRPLAGTRYGRSQEPLEFTSDVKLTIDGEARSATKEIRLPLAWLVTGTDDDLNCYLNAQQDGISTCSLSIIGRAGTLLSLRDVVGKILQECTVPEGSGGCWMDIPSPVAKDGIVLYASRPGYASKNQRIRTTLMTPGQDGDEINSAREFDAKYCPGSACTLSFRELEADPEYYKGRLVRFSGSVSELQRSGDTNFMRVATSGYRSNDFAAAWSGDRYGITRGNYVTVYGVITDNFSYETVAGWQRTIPRVIPIAIRAGNQFGVIR